MENKKSIFGDFIKSLFVIAVAIVLVLSGYAARKYIESKKENKIETTPVTDGSTTNTTAKTADEMYQEYLANLKKNIDKTYQEIPDVSDDELAKLEQNSEAYTYGGMSLDCAVDDIEGYKYCPSISNGELNVSAYDVDNNYKLIKSVTISKNVLQAFISEIGNAGTSSVFYLTEDGKMHSIWCGDLTNDSKKAPETLKLKNIVGVISSTFGILSGGHSPIFVDIEGNLFDAAGTQLHAE